MALTSTTPRKVQRMIHHKTNPFPPLPVGSQMVVFSPDTYQLNVVATLGPSALRCLFVLIHRLQADGLAVAEMADLRNAIGSPVPTLNKGLIELELHDLIRKQTFGRYWVNPKLCRVITVK